MGTMGYGGKPRENGGKWWKMVEKIRIVEKLWKHRGKMVEKWWKTMGKW
jgi:hypothetical protein